MAKKSDTNKAIANLLKWAERPEWAEAFGDVFADHLGPVSKKLAISEDALNAEIAELGYDSMVFGMVFEDFLTRRLPPDDRNIIDDYLQRRGWRESGGGRRYLQQLRDSAPSLYEVVEVSQGRYCVLQDLVRGGKPLRVHEQMGTTNMVKWDRLAARVLSMDGKAVFSGGILPIAPETSQSLLGLLAKSRKRFEKHLGKTGGNPLTDKIHATVDLGRLFLQSSAGAFTTLWLLDVLEQLGRDSAPLPEIVNRDGEALVASETRFPFAVAQRVEIARRLDAAPEWERDAPDASTWTWLPAAGAGAGNISGHEITIDTFQGGLRHMLGTLTMRDGALTLSTNSLQRTERGKQELDTLLGDLVGTPLGQLQTPEQLLADGRSRGRDGAGREPDPGIDPGIAAEIIHRMQDNHYRDCLDQPIPALGNKTPRQCVKTRKGRERVIDWLKYLENNEQRRALERGQIPYDTAWLWDELNLRD